MSVIWEIKEPKTRASLLSQRRKVVEDSLERWVAVILRFSDAEFFKGRINTDLSEYQAYTTGETQPY